MNDGVEIWKSRTAEVGGQSVDRALPKRGHRTVGPWCFVDIFGPSSNPMAATRIGPHPHIGLHTVTWLFDGEIVHTDSLGSDQAIRPGQLNLMTAGNGVAHAEQTPTDHRGPVHGVQLWVAQPERTRHGPAAFEHHGELPAVQIGSSEATVLVGTFDGATSPARADVSTVGVQATVRGALEVGLEPTHEHVLVVIDGSVTLDGRPLLEHEAAYLPLGTDTLALWADDPARVLLLGGEPYESEILMWWNFVARTWSEIHDARAAWEAHDQRFPVVASSLDRVPAPPLP